MNTQIVFIEVFIILGFFLFGYHLVKSIKTHGFRYTAIMVAILAPTVASGIFIASIELINFNEDHFIRMACIWFGIGVIIKSISLLVSFIQNQKNKHEEQCSEKKYSF